MGLDSMYSPCGQTPDHHQFSSVSSILVLVMRIYTFKPQRSWYISVDSMGASSGAQWCTSPSPACKGYSFINVDSQRPYKISRDEVTNRDYRPMKMGFFYIFYDIFMFYALLSHFSEAL